ncbi:RNA polymerase subunit sigma [Paraburkholderia bonniea]|nr:RNA polymerase subunit sigma [Paraburkholderia bonniea]WJF89362.1 RNA polymerase subunit sigma [Paraburkholderia bonniea]WJF92677.1 RNA polymerase subunit sigma [Paraburkholderia bonniea]
MRAAASSRAAAASFELLAPGRLAADAAAFATFTGACCAGMAEDSCPVAGASLAADAFFAEEADLACVTFLVGSSEPLPVAFFPLVVFAIAIALFYLGILEMKLETAENL